MATNLKEVTYRRSDDTWHTSYKNCNRHGYYHGIENVPMSVRLFVESPNTVGHGSDDNNLMTYTKMK